jgi:hypothetical protein
MTRTPLASKRFCAVSAQPGVPAAKLQSRAACPILYALSTAGSCRRELQKDSMRGKMPHTRAPEVAYGAENCERLRNRGKLSQGGHACGSGRSTHRAEAFGSEA